MKHLLIPALCALSMLSAAAATETANGVDWTYRVENGEARLDARASAQSRTAAVAPATVGPLTVPERLGGCPVVEIGLLAFGGVKDATAILIPESVREIGCAAFSGCTGLTGLAVPSSVTNIGDCAFFGCTGLKALYLPAAFAGATDSLGIPATCKVHFGDPPTLALNLQGGSAARTSVPAIYKAALPDIAPPVRAGYVFQGFWTEKKGAGTQFYDGTGKALLKWKSKAGATLYAKWARVKYTVKFSGNGGKAPKSSPMKAQTMSYGKEKALRANTFARSGYTFLGWAKSKTGAVAYADAQVVSNLRTTPGKVVLHAIWAKSKYAVSFHANGGQGSMAAQTFTYGKAAKLSANAFVRPGYIFQGWAKSKTGAVAYADRKSVKNLVKDGSTVKLYAVWAIDEKHLADEVAFAQLNWSYGAFDGAGAALADKPRIADLKVSSKGMSYSWAKGGCEDLGAASSSDFSQTVACLFCLVDGKWSGGKFDWISTSRRSRDFVNIRDSYHGWPANSIERAKAFAFVIVSRDGKSRTNVIRCGGL